MSPPAITASAPLSEIEADELARLERGIEREQASYLTLGRSLARIRDSRLYRQTSKTFEAYCEKRWDMSRDYAYRLIQAAEVVAVLRAEKFRRFPENEAQARILAKLAADGQVAVWRLTIETARGRITADHVARCAERHLGRPVDARPGEVSAAVAEVFAALPPERQLEILRANESAATGEARSRRIDRSDRERVGQIERLTERLRRLHAGRVEVANEADTVLGLYAAVVHEEVWALELARKIGHLPADSAN